MALIVCPECNASISDKATLCPSCGFPIGNHIQSEKEEEMRPKFPDKLLSVGTLSVGNSITNWWGNSLITGYVDYSDDSSINKKAKAYIQLCDNGLQIPNGLFSKLKIHDLQILNVFCDGGSTIEQRGGMMGKIAIGTLIGGRFGAELGVLSSMQSTKREHDYFNLRYWDLQTRELRLISVKCKKGSCDKFMNRLLKRFGTEHL